MMMIMMMMKLDTPFMINNPGGTISKFVSYCSPGMACVIFQL